ncbi:VOC family protein [Chelativorans salis]|uniref:VOC family protein n=1 Tax=Chelativorans salis TaxID=2978478 RepID=A0ABT2LPP7_9HYPH|nr:VOC family protein [Chelativorans sp. EGI FJ00035]MCT7375363.1 VOC family protein [Chelativorans sp. EGI FJ00035]
MKLDHCVLPTKSLATARERLASLGFTVAPDAAHPFGTANCCVFFENGSYLEPLSIADEEAARGAIAAGNTFVLRDRAFREACGEEGFSAIALGTGNTAAEHARFVKERISAGRPLSFSRPFVDAGGNRAQASFELAFAAPGSCPSFFFACQRVNMPVADRSLRRHDNGVVGISRILATAAEPSAGKDFFTRLFRKEPDDGAGIWTLSPERPQGGSPPHAAVWLLGHADARHFCRIEAGGDDRLRLCGIVFRTPSIDAIAERLAVAKIAHTMHRNRILVPPAPGQGAVFIFEEVESSAFETFLGYLLFLP